MPPTTSRGWPGYIAATTFILLSAIATQEMRLGKASSSLAKIFESIAETNKFPSPLPDISLRTHYTGIAPIDLTLKFLVAAFLPGVAGWDGGSQVQQIYFLVSFFAVIGLWSIEAGRAGAKGLIRFTSIWAIFYQTVGGAIIIPLYYLAYMRESARDEYWSPTSRRIPVAYSKALLPALVLGYLVPTIAMYLPLSDPDLYFTQGLVAFWQPTPFLVNFLLFLFTSFAGKTAAVEKSGDRRVESRYLNRTYIVLFVVSAVTHIGILTTCLVSEEPQKNIIRALGFIPTSERGTMPGALLYIFQVDYWIIFAAALGGGLLSIWDVKRRGIELSLGKMVLGTGLSVLSVGPAATAVVIAWTREGALRGERKVKK